MTRSSDKASDFPQPPQEDCEDRCDVGVIHAMEVQAARTRVPGEEALERGVEIASLLANPTRLRILAALAPGPGGPDPELCVCDLAVVVGASETQTSHQLRALRLADLVHQRRDGRLVYYRLGREPRVRAAVLALTTRDS